MFLFIELFPFLFDEPLVYYHKIHLSVKAVAKTALIRVITENKCIIINLERPVYYFCGLSTILKYIHVRYWGHVLPCSAGVQV